MNLGRVCIFVFAAGLAGCAAGGPVERPPVPAATLTVAAPSRPAPASAAAGADTMPSPEALTVLATIPEPVPAPANGGSAGPAAPRASTPAPAVPPPAVAAAPAPDSGAAAGEGAIVAADTASVPVPAPTTPLGAGSPALRPTPEPPVVAPPPAAAAPPAVVVAPAAAGPDTCWRVQLGAPSERARGRVLRDASQSLLMVPMTVQLDAGRWKVRTRECLSRRSAESLRDRAVASGFRGVFLVRFVERR